MDRVHRGGLWTRVYRGGPWTRVHVLYTSLVGITPSGAVSFISKLYTGSISDREIVERCGILDLLEDGDGVMGLDY